MWCNRSVKLSLSNPLFDLQQRTTINSLQTASAPSSLAQAERHTSKPRTAATRRNRARQASHHRTCKLQALTQQHNRTMETFRFTARPSSTIQMMYRLWIEDFSLEVICLLGVSFFVFISSASGISMCMPFDVVLVLLFLYVIFVVLDVSKPVHFLCGDYYFK